MLRQEQEMTIVQTQLPLYIAFTELERKQILKVLKKSPYH